jgi:hypothetical protein
VTTAIFGLAGGGPVAGSVTCSGTTATFTPLAALAYNTTYTATITPAVKDLAGNAMAGSYTWSFTTGAAPDITPPAVSSTSPPNAATGVAVNTAVTATFTEALSASTVTSASFTVNGGGTVAGTVTYSGTTATFTPFASLAYSTTYTATITTAVKDLAGNAMEGNHTWSFTTGLAPDTTPPAVSSTNPANAATGVAVNAAVTATFTEALNASTVTSASFTLTGGGAVAGTVTYSGTKATFTSSAGLLYDWPYTATITTGVKDLAGNAMVAPYPWSFTTAAAPGVLYSQPVLPTDWPTAALLRSSNIVNTGHNATEWVWEGFALASAQTITQIGWRGGYDPTQFGAGLLASDFTVGIWGSIPGGTQPDVTAGPLVTYAVGGNAGETLAGGTFSLTNIYDYAFTLPTPFPAQAGTKYWVQIEAVQTGSFPDWGLAKGTGPDNAHFRRRTNPDIYEIVPGDAAISVR